MKAFCAIPQVLAFLKDYIVFAEKDEELNKDPASASDGWGGEGGGAGLELSLAGIPSYYF